MRQNQVCDQEKWIGIKFTIQKVGLKSTFDPESRAKIHFRSILWVWNPFFWFEMPCFDPENWFVAQVMVQKNPFPIHFCGSKSIFWFEMPCFDPENWFVVQVMVQKFAFGVNLFSFSEKWFVFGAFYGCMKQGGYR